MSYSYFYLKKDNFNSNSLISTYNSFEPVKEISNTNIVEEIGTNLIADRFHSANKITISDNLLTENALIEMDRKYNNTIERLLGSNKKDILNKLNN